MAASIPSLKHLAFAGFLFFAFLALFFLSSAGGAGSGLGSSQETDVAGGGDDGECKGLSAIEDYGLKCAYVREHGSCGPEGFVDYLELFYCGFHGRRLRPLGYSLAFAWLAVLFYLLGNTAADYFCSSLEGLSASLRLPPTIAGVTLLSLGNGAPDVFSSVVSFAAGGGNGDVGISSVLGGALFVSTVVVGVVAIAGERRGTVVHRCGFVKNVCFLLLVAGSLAAILAAGEINVAGALAFLGLYVAYVAMVSASHCCQPEKERLSAPLLADDDDVERAGAEDDTVSLVKDAIESGAGAGGDSRLHCVVELLAMPLYLPRRLTIPDISNERWSKGYAVAAAACSPPFAALLYSSANGSMTADGKATLLIAAALVGLVLGGVAMAKTSAAAPPTKGRLPWLAGEFAMSVVWSYLIARELVALLVSIGFMLGIKSTVLGVTVLAWGNSVGDLVADLALAVNGGADGAQIAVAGCYAGPLFNAAVGLGLSMVFAAWRAHPAPFVVPADESAFLILGFLVAGLLLALAVLPARGMKLDRVLGIALLVVYFSFLAVRLTDIGLLGQSPPPV